MGTDRPEQTGDSGEAGFRSLLLKLGTAGLIHLGAAPDPGSDKTTVDLAQAKQVIDLLDLLRVKTAGNLTAGESRMLDDLLFDLRMRYLDAEKRA